MLYKNAIYPRSMSGWCFSNPRIIPQAGNYVTIIDMKETLSPPEAHEQGGEGLVDALIVVSLGDGDLPQEDRLSILGAGLLKDLGITNGAGKIILSSNPSHKEGVPSRAQLMRDHLIDTFGIPKKSIIVDDSSNNSENEAEELKKIMRRHRLKSLGLVSTASLDREKIQDAFKRVGLRIEQIPPDVVLANRFPEFVGNLKKSPKFIMEVTKEALEKFLRTHRMLESIHIGRVSLL